MAAAACDANESNTYTILEYSQARSIVAMYEGPTRGPNFPLLGHTYQRLCDRGAFVLNDTGCSDVWRTDVE